jgi:hypothetical protein
MPSNASHRTFKTARFSKDAKKSKIKDPELCIAIQQVLLGRVEQLLANGDFVEICHDDKTEIQK